MIVGAGITGCYLGKLIGDCKIWELRKDPWDKTCGGLFSKNIKHLDIGIKESVLNEVKGARFYSGNESFEIKKSETQAYVVDRFSLQKSMIQDAESKNCRISWSRPWRGHEDDFVLGADGAYSAVMQSCGIKRNYFNCYQAECTLKNKTDTDFVELHFGSFAPGFFAWLIPVDEKTARIGLGCRNENPKNHFESFIKKFSVEKILKEQAALIPVYDGQETVFENRALVGDAAGQVKATSGGGVVFGCMCAEELKKAVDSGDLQKYEESWRREYSSDLRNHLLARRFLDKAGYEKLFRVIKEKRINEVIEECGDMESTSDMKRALLKKPLTCLSLAKLIF